MLLLVLLLCPPLLAAALENGQALIPPMGWLSWERFRCNTDCIAEPNNCISERLIKQMADRLIDDGFSELGYNLVGIDDCWSAKKRDTEGRLQADPVRFPSGMKALGDYIHERELTFGIYGDIGTKTCGGYPGMAASFSRDAQTYADWGVDYLKVDGCYADPQSYGTTYPALGEALNQTGRPITYSCSWPAYLPDPVQTGFQVPYEALRKTCNLWRNWVDIQDSWESLSSILVFWAEASLKSQGFQRVASPGAWNDPDMLIIGNHGLTEEQERVQMGMWALFSAPLLMSNDLRDLRPSSKSILQNKLAIEINQDSLGFQGVLLSCLNGCHSVQMWHKRLRSGRAAVGFLSLGGKTVHANVCILWKDLHLDLSEGILFEVTNVFEEEVTRQYARGSLCVQELKPTSLQLFLLRPWKPHEMTV